jgi:uncharacterized protein YjiS (DUF1127 family)
MTRIYAATVVAIFVTTSLATNVLFVGTRRPVTSDLSLRLRSVSRQLNRRVRRLIDTWVAATIARREQQAAAWALHHVSDRELRDIGLHRVRVGRGHSHVGHVSVDSREFFSIAHPLEGGMQ